MTNKAEYDNTNRGVLFKNSNKKSDKHPDYTGQIDVDGTEKRLAAWIRTSKIGTTFLSIAVSEVQDKIDQRTDKGHGADSDIPF
jgi:uncharacterized protein (DUF736 family)